MPTFLLAVPTLSPSSWPCPTKLDTPIAPRSFEIGAILQPTDTYSLVSLVNISKSIRLAFAGLKWPRPFLDP